MAYLLPWTTRRDAKDFRVRRGLDVTIAGTPRQEVGEKSRITTIALMGRDYPGLRPAMKVAIGDRVAAGDVLFVDRRRPQITITAPAAGTILSVIGYAPRGPEQFLEIRLDGDGARTFDTPGTEPTNDDARTLLLESGMWPAFRARPFGHIPDPDARPAAIFVTAMESDPLTANAAIVIDNHKDDFAAGLRILERLTDGPVHVCQAPGQPLATGAVTFAGPHPAGLPGTHIHKLFPVGNGCSVWHLNYQDTIAIGRLFTCGQVWAERIVALAGPGVRDPRLCPVPLGASLAELTLGQLREADMRVISGSVLSGRKAPYLGRYHLQVSVIPEGWDAPKPSFLRRAASTALNGRPGPLVPLASFEQVLPLDIPAVPLLRALSVGDRDAAQRLGCLELVEEDVALLSYVCPGRTDYAPLLRAVLDDIEADSGWPAPFSRPKGLSR
jgi:Na+-transporting NADH:ubiquinone oxidoreductase subunit A